MKPAGPILQVGFGAFGRTHLRAWQMLGLENRLTIAEPNEVLRHAAAEAAPQARVIADYREALASCMAIDIVAPTDLHFAVALDAIRAGKPAFIEKPAVASASEARILVDSARQAATLVRVGYYFRRHPKSMELRRSIAAGELGALRLLSGRFAGFKRARTDSGVLHNDAVHFLDLFCWLVGSMPTHVFAVTRDHFSRGMEDMALIVLEWSGGAAAQIECGYVQPGSWPDTVVPGAVTSKAIAVSGSLGAVEIDFAAETYVHHAARHENRDGVWTPRFDAPPAPRAVAAATAEMVVAAELLDFMRGIDDKADADANDFAADGLDGGLNMAILIEAAQASARRHAVVATQE